MADLEAEELSREIESFLVERGGSGKPFYRNIFTEWATSHGITFDNKELMKAVRILLSRGKFTVYLDLSGDEGETFVVAQWYDAPEY